METKEFLQFFQESVFQTFLDNPSIKTNERPTIFYDYKESEFQNLNRKGFGIYFTPNGFKNGRKLENLTKLNAVYGDLDIAKEGDGKTKEEKDKLKNTLKQALVLYCNPNFIIETKNGLQPLWLIKADLTEENKTLYTKVVQGITEWSKQFGGKGDKVKDISRVLRLPGFYHLKNLKDPFRCSVEEWADHYYKLEELARSFPYTEVLPPEPTKTPTEFKKGYEAQQIDFIDIQEIVIRAYAYRGQKAEFDKQKRLILDGRLTGTHQGKTGDGQFIASSSHDPIKGNKITVVAEILGITSKEAFLWIIEEFKLKEKKAKEQIKKAETIPEPKKREKYYSWGTIGLTERIAPIKSDTYAIIGAGAGVGKTTFCFNMAQENCKLGHKTLYLSLEMSTEDIFDYLARTKAQITIKDEIYNQIPEGKQRIYNQRREELSNYPNLTLKGIRGGIMVYWETLEELMKGDYDLIFIDNFNCIKKQQGQTDNEHERFISAKILEYTTIKQVPIILVHHYSKGGAQMKEKTGYSLSGSAQLVNDATRVLLLDRKKFDEDEQVSPEERCKLNITIDKARGYPDGFKRSVYWQNGSFYDTFQTELGNGWWSNM